jgi:hypothetical protein
MVWTEVQKQGMVKRVLVMSSNTVELLLPTLNKNNLLADGIIIIL